MWDPMVPVIGLTMRADALASMSKFDLPEGIGVGYYHPGTSGSGQNCGDLRVA